MCQSGKRPYSTPTAAYKAAVKHSCGYRDRRPMLAYQCPHCHQWHLTSTIRHTQRPQPAPQRISQTRLLAIVEMDAV